MTNEKTTGAINIQALESAPDSRSPQEIINYFSHLYEETRNEYIVEGKKLYPHNNFFLVGSIKSEKLMERVLPRILWDVRLSCPKPFFDQIVYHYTHMDDQLKELWVVPDMETYNMYLRDALFVDPSERALRDYCIDFKSGDLKRLSLRLNKDVISKAE